jgi:hypothetical protein
MVAFVAAIEQNRIEMERAFRRAEKRFAKLAGDRHKKNNGRIHREPGPCRRHPETD